MEIYLATEKDIPNLIQIRIDFLNIDKGFLSEREEELIRDQCTAYFTKYIALGYFLASIAKINGTIISAAFLTIQERPANSSFITGITGTLLNVITYPEFQKKGFATQVIEFLINEAKMKGVSSIDLLATEKGKSVYKKLGFSEPSYTAMRLKL